MKTPFGWVGSKSRCHKEIINEFPITFKNYYEPFLGCGSIFFNLFNCKRVFSKAYLSDVNHNLINCYIAIRDEPDRIKKVLIHCCERNSEEFYYEMRKNVSSPAVFIYLMRACFSSLYRENQSGEFNTPWRKQDYIVMRKKISMETDTIDRCSEYLRKWCGDMQSMKYGNALKSVSEGDVVYCDPPYLPYTDTGFVAYEKSGFTTADHVYLNNLCRMTANIKQCKIFLSNSITPKTIEIYGEPFKVISVGDSVKSTAVVKGRRLEGLWKY
jgi:DNA adenine methylase